MMVRHIEVKICGLTNLDDTLAALESGADYLGFVFHPDSPRAITAARVISILDKITVPFKAVGVFVNTPRIDVEVLAGDCGLYAVQLHGAESAEDFLAMPVPIWRSLKFASAFVEPTPERWAVARYVVDAAVPGKHGGTGVLADWNRASEISTRYPTMLAGGLTPDNVAASIKTVKPLGVDVVSGVEAKPGRKDHRKLQHFIRAAKQ